jgi:peptidoglycan hydrolase CwlO-like protein
LILSLSLSLSLSLIPAVCASPSNTLREFQSQFYKELSLKVEIQNLHKKAERRLNKLKKRVEREQKIINELIDQRTKLQNELNSLKSTFKELETECERLEEDTLLYLHDVTIAEWKRTLENKLHNTLKKLEQQIDEQSFLTEVHLHNLLCEHHQEREKKERERETLYILLIFI